MREPDFGPMSWRNAQASLLIAAIGLITLVGSGGGVGVGCLFCTPGDPIPWLDVSVNGPPVVQVGETATFYSYMSGGYLGQPPNTYRWCRSAGGAAPCVEIAGATESFFHYQGANLADDGAVFSVTLRDGDKVATAQATLHVSNTPPVVFEDGEFQPGVWTVTAVGPAASSPSLQSAERMASGGNPGAYLRTEFGKPAGAGSTFVFYVSTRAEYDPATQGAIYAVEAVMDTLPLSPALPWGQRELWLLVEQGGHRYGAPAGAFDVSQAGWVSAARAASRLYTLTAIPFSLADGTTCGAPGWPCSPDFSATAAPLRFGFAYVLNWNDAVAVNSGIDNWKVTVWRR